MRIDINDIVVQYNLKVVLDKISLSLTSGDVCLIKGCSGSGKTTLLNVIAGYMEELSGDIAIDKNAKIEYLYQDEMLFSNLTVRENMQIKYNVMHDTIDNSEAEFRAILKKVNIEELLDSQVALLSGGERQRVQIANMMIMDPDIILMDEPTSKLDIRNKTEIIENILEIFQGKILIIVSHDNLEEYIGTAKLFELNGGKLIEVQ